MPWTEPVQRAIAEPDLHFALQVDDKLPARGIVPIAKPPGLGDGSVHRFGPGHVTLAEDLTGKGHTTRVVGNRPRLTATIPLADG